MILIFHQPTICKKQWCACAPDLNTEAKDVESMYGPTMSNKDKALNSETFVCCPLYTWQQKQTAT